MNLIDVFPILRVKNLKTGVEERLKIFSDSFWHPISAPRERQLRLMALLQSSSGCEQFSIQFSLQGIVWLQLYKTMIYLVTNMYRLATSCDFFSYNYYLVFVISSHQQLFFVHY